MEKRTYNYYKNRLKALEFPYAVLDVALFQQNIDANLKRAGNKQIRVATKSIRLPWAIRTILDSNEQFQGLMTYHGRETHYLAEQGFDDLLLGYPIADSRLIHALGLQIKAGKQITFMVDSIEHLQLIEAEGRALKTVLPVCVDIDLSDNYPGLHFGVWRSSIVDVETLSRFLTALSKMDYVKLDGLMGYEAQVAGVGDQVPNNYLKNQAIRFLKSRAVPALRKKRKAALDMIAAAGLQLRFVNGGGTGSLESTREEAGVTEITVGSGFFNSHLFDQYRAFQLQPALFYGVQIVRKPDSKTYTAHGGGYIASGAVDATKAPIVHFPETGKLDALEGAGEVQTPIRFSNQASPLKIGDPIYLRHAKAGELCERFNQVYLLKDDQLEATKTYRGEGHNFG